MSNPQESQGGPEKVKSASTASYPMQLIVLLVVFAVALGVYIYFTSGDDDGGSMGGRIEQTLEHTA